MVRQMLLAVSIPWVASLWIGGCAAPQTQQQTGPVPAERIEEAPPRPAPVAVTAPHADAAACFRPEAWSRKGMFFLLRPEADSGDTWLLTIQTFDQKVRDVLDNRTDHYPHEAVFRLDIAAASLQPVDDAVWQGSDAWVRECGPSAKVARKLTVDNGRLLHEGRPVSTTGSTVLALYPAPVSDVAAVLSVDRRGEANGAAATHYHQVFWDDDGTPMGPPVRLNFVRAGGRHTTACWTPDDRCVLYVQGREGYSETEQFCVVPVAE